MSNPNTQPYWRLDFMGDNNDIDRDVVPFSYLFKVGLGEVVGHAHCQTVTHHFTG